MKLGKLLRLGRERFGGRKAAIATLPEFGCEMAVNCKGLLVAPLSPRREYFLAPVFLRQFFVRIELSAFANCRESPLQKQAIQLFTRQQSVIVVRICKMADSVNALLSSTTDSDWIICHSCKLD